MQHKDIVGTSEGVTIFSTSGIELPLSSGIEFPLIFGIEESPVRADTEVILSLKAHGFTDFEITKLIVSKRSLERRQQKKEPLSAVETERALRVVRIHDHAVRVFGSEEKAHRWLRKPCRALDGAIPLDLLASETGAHIVDTELHAIDHGMFA